MYEFKNSFKNLISRAKWSGFFMMNLKRTILFITIPLLIVNTFASFYYYKKITTDARSASEQVFLSTSNTVQNIYMEAENLFCTLVLDPGLDIFMKTEDVVSLDAQTLAIVRQPLKTAATHCTLSNNIESVEICSHKTDYVLSTYGGDRKASFSNHPWYSLSSDNLSFYAPKDKGGFSICYNIVNNMQKTGLMVFNIKKDIFTNESEQNFSLKLLDENGKPFYSTGNMTDSSPDLSVEENKISVKQTNKYIMLTSRLGNNTYLYMEIEQAKPIYSTFIWMTVLTFLVILVSSLILSYVLSSYNYKFVRDIAININDVGLEDRYDTFINEITYINQNILQMKDKNQQLEQEVVKSFANLKKLQTQVLQVQFTPHFLFNTLNALNTSLMIKYGADNPESETILTLSKLLTSSIDIQHYMVTVAQEIDYSNEYIKIQSVLSKGNFDVFWDIDEEVKNCVVVKFVLQPLIENAFKHGIKFLQNKSRGFLKICAKKEGNNIVLRVVNNGPVPDERTLERLNDMLISSLGTSEKHVGLFNTNKRIKLVFGNDYGCRIGIEDGLTAVYLTAPAITEFDINKN